MTNYIHNIFPYKGLGSTTHELHYSTVVLYIADIQSNRVYLNRSIVMKPGDVVSVELDKYQVVIEFHERTKPLTNTLIIDPCTCRCS